MSRPATAFYWKARHCYATDVGGKRTVLVKGPKTKANREAALQQLARLLRPGSTALAVNPKLTLAEVVDAFLMHCQARLDAGDLKSATLGSYYRPYAKLLKKHVGAWRVNAITETMVLRFRCDLNGRVAHNTVKNYLGTLRTILKRAYRQGWAPEFAYQLVPPLPRKRRQNIPSHDEVRRLLEAARPDVADVLRTLLLTPIRPGDAFNLRRDGVDLDNALLRLPDSQTGQRLVPLTPPVIEILKCRLQSTTNDEDFVFVSLRGCRWRQNYFAELVRKARLAAGLGEITAYVLRHFWTTTALLNGCSLHEVKALRGDRSINTVFFHEHLASQQGFMQQAARRAVGLPPDEAAPRTPPDREGESESRRS